MGTRWPRGTNQCAGSCPTPEPTFGGRVLSPFSDTSGDSALLHLSFPVCEWRSTPSVTVGEPLSPQPSLPPPTPAVVAGHLSACQSEIQQESSSVGAGVVERKRAGGEGTGAPDPERLPGRGLHWGGLGHSTFVPTHGAVEADGLHSADTSRESVAPPSAARGLPGPPF